MKTSISVPRFDTVRTSLAAAFLLWAMLGSACVTARSDDERPTRLDPETARRQIDDIVAKARDALQQRVTTAYQGCSDGDGDACQDYARNWGRLLATAPQAAVPPMTAEIARRRACEFGVQPECKRATEAGDPERKADTVAPVMRPPSEALQTPPMAKRLGVEGFVEAALLIRSDGHVADIVLHRARPIGFFEEAAIAFLSQLQYEPARYQGQPVELWVRQRVKFCADPGSDFVNRPAPLCEAQRAARRRTTTSPRGRYVATTAR